MRIKTVLILTIVLIAAALIILFFIRKGLKTASLPEENTAPEETEITNQEQPKETTAPRRIIQQGAITVIETPHREHATPAPLAKAKENEMRRANSPSSSQGTPLQITSSAAPSAAAGITVINKEPTPIEKKEMQSKGIMIY